MTRSLAQLLTCAMGISVAVSGCDDDAAQGEEAEFDSASGKADDDSADPEIDWTPVKESPLGLSIPYEERTSRFNVRFMRAQFTESFGQAHYYEGQAPYCVELTSEYTLEQLYLVSDPFGDRTSEQSTKLEPVVQAKIWWVPTEADADDENEANTDDETADALTWGERCETAAAQDADYGFELKYWGDENYAAVYRTDNGVESQFRPSYSGQGQFSFFFEEDKPGSYADCVTGCSSPGVGNVCTCISACGEELRGDEPLDCE